MEVTNVIEVQTRLKKWISKFGIEVPVIVVGDFSSSWHHNGLIGLSKHDFIGDLKTELTHKLAIVTVNHEWLHFILWSFVGLESPQGYDDVLKRMGFYTIQKAYEWKTYPDVASLAKCHAGENRKKHHEYEPETETKINAKRGKKAENSLKPL